MKIITKNPILVNPETTYSALDGSSSKDEIKAFQKWVWYVKGDKSLKTSKAPDGVDGIFGKRTSSALAKYAVEYAKFLAPTTNTTPTEVTAPIEKPIEENPKDEVVKDKAGWWKNRTKNQKRLIVVGGIALVVVVGILVYKSRKNKK